MQEHNLADKEQARRWAREFAAQLVRPCVVRLTGEMGAGKTQLVRWFLEALGVADAASPTFAIHHEYTAATGPVDHVDLYRVKNDGDLESSGFWDLFSNPRGLVLVEWADRLPDDVWPPWTSIVLHVEKSGSEQSRRIRVKITPPP